jgi:hypothetical protein
LKEKATHTKLLESKQSTSHLDDMLDSMIDATLFDGGLVLHEVLPRHNTSTYGKIITDNMIKVCSASGDSAHLLLDKYVEPSIKDVERLNRGAVQDEMNTLIVTGRNKSSR